MDFVNLQATQAARRENVRKVRGWLETRMRTRDELDDDDDDDTDGESARASSGARVVVRAVVVAEREVEDHNNDDDDDDDDDDGLHGYTVLVQEMTCNIPGCAPIETVVAMLKRGANRNGKIFKPIAEVTEGDVDALMLELFGDPNSVETAMSAADSTSGESKTDGAAAATNTTVAAATKKKTKKRDDAGHPFLCPCCNPDVTRFDKMIMFGPGLDHI